MEIWNSKILDLAKTYHAQIGPLGLWVKRVNGEVHVAQAYSPEDDSTDFFGLKECDPALTAGMVWLRWVVDKNVQQVRLKPCLSNRPVVVRTESPVRISANREAVFYVSFPIWIKIEAGAGTVVELSDIPTAIRSNTWFGDTMAGELCYSLITRARRLIEDADHPAYKVLCPVKIRNNSNEPLDVERFCIHVEHLNLYQGTYSLWTNEVTIVFEGGDQTSRIDYAKQKPKLGSDLKLITPPRIPLKETILKRSLVGFVRSSDI